MSRRPSVYQDVTFPEIGKFIGAQSNALNYERERDALDRKAAVPPKIDTGYLEKANVGVSGINPVDAYTTTGLNKILNSSYQALQSGANPIEVQMNTQSEVGKLNRGSILAKNGKAQVDDVAKEMHGKYSPEEIERFTNLGYGNISNLLLSKDQNGEASLNDLSHIPLDKSFTSDLFEPQNMGQWANLNGSPAEGFMKGLPQIPFSKEDEVNDKGNIVKVGYKGAGTPLTKQVIDPKTGEVTGIETVHETIPVGRAGIKVKVLPSEVENQMLADPLVKAKLNSQFAKQLAEYEQRTGENVSPEDAHKYMRAFLFDEADKYHDQHFDTNKREVTPKPPVTNIHVNNGKDKEVNIRDVYGEIQGAIEKMGKMGNGPSISMPHLGTTAQTVVLKYAKELAKEDDLEAKDIYIAKGKDGKTYIFKTADSSVVGPLDFTDANVTSANPSVVEKREVIKQGKQQGGATPPSASGKIHFIGPDGKTYEGTEETLKKMDKAGVKYTRK